MDGGGGGPPWIAASDVLDPFVNTSYLSSQKNEEGELQRYMCISKEKTIKEK